MRPPTSFLRISALLLLFFLCIPCHVFAASTLRMMSEDNREVTWNLSADRMITDSGGSVLEAFGKVELRMGDDYLRADFARYYTQTNWVYLYGNVELVFGDDLLNAHQAEFDLRSRTGWLRNGRIFLAESNSYFWGEHITKHRGNVYSFKEVKYTACDGDTPAWSFEADKGVLEVEEYAQFWGTSFQVSDLSVLYSPYLVLPAKTKRQSGFLMPDQGKSDKHGFFYSQPFFWVIDDSRDLTLTETYMSKRGFMHGFNYRSQASEDEYLWLSFDYLKDRQRVTSDANDKYYDGDGLIRSDTSRYWIRGMYDWRLPGDPLWRIRADVDYTSDQYYLREFRRFSTGYNKSRDALFDVFSRDLRNDTEKRTSSAMLFRDWEKASIYLSGTYTQDPRLGNADPSTPWAAPKTGEDTTVQHLPELNLYLQQGRIVDSLPLEIQASAQVANLYRREGTSGTRFDISPRIILPISGKYGSLISSARLRSTWYRTETRADTAVGAAPVDTAKKNASRYLPDFELKGSTEFSRIYQLEQQAALQSGEKQWVGIRHNIIPRLTYRHTTHEDQRRNPQYTSYDNLAPVHELVYSLDNVLTRKRESSLTRNVVDEEGNTEVETYSRYDYRDFVRLRLEQSYDINEARRGHDLHLYDREPWRDVMAELTFYLTDYFRWSSTSYWTPSESKFTRHTQSAHVTVPGVGNFSSSFQAYSPRKPDAVSEGRATRLTTASFEGNIHVYGPWSVSAYYDWGIKGNAKDERGLTVNYTHQCFSISGQIIRDEDDTTYRMSFSLSGMGM